MTSTPSAGAGQLEVDASAAKAAAPGRALGGEAWTRDFVKRMACGKFLAAAEPWTAKASWAARSLEGVGVAAVAAEADRRRWRGASGRRREERRRRSGGESGIGLAFGARQI